MLLNESDGLENGILLRAMLKDVRGGETHFLYKFGDTTYYKKVRLKVLQSMAVLLAQLSKTTRFAHYSSAAPIWDSLATSEWGRDILALPMQNAGIQCWGSTCA